MSNFANPELENSFLKIILASNTPAAPAVVFANDLTKGLYWDVNGLHLTGLPASPSDNTEAASKAYVDAQAGGGGATTALDNLAAVAINTDLLPNADNTISLGSPSLNIHNLYIQGIIQTNGAPVSLLGGNIVFDGTQIIGPSDFQLSSATTDMYMRFQDSTGDNIIHSTNSLAILTPNASATFDNSAVARDTRMLLWDVDSGALQRVTVGDADSGGTGFKVLRIPN